MSAGGGCEAAVTARTRYEWVTVSIACHKLFGINLIEKKKVSAVSCCMAVDFF